MTYKIIIDNRNYTTWNIVTANTLERVSIDLKCNPIQHKLFTSDVFTFIENKVHITHSSVRIIDNIPGVLIISNNKTYGRNKGNNGKLLYKCIPDDTRIPAFLVPYEIKHMGFSKVFSNLYVTIHFSSWTDKHPHGTITQTIGSVDVLDNFYEYQLYCKSLNSSIQKFTKDTTKAINERDCKHDAFIEKLCTTYPQIENRTAWHIFTIDPSKSLDFDDAFSIKPIDDNKVLLSIYIANVTIWMDALNLWQSFSQRISTIYLPDRKRPMLPTILSDCLCSLQSNASRVAFVMDIIIDSNNNIVSVKYSNCIIRVFKNYVYEEPDLLKNAHYLKLLNTVKNLSKKFKYISSVKNSHDVVCYLMVLMNYNCAKELLKTKSGIFRSTIVKTNDSIVLPDYVPEDVSKFIKIWNSSCGQYVDVSSIDDKNVDKIIKHEMLEMDAYIHITSPIRRLVDLLNIIKFQQNFGLIALSENASDFYLKWIQQIDYINVTMRAIRKVQNDCNLLDTCTNDPEKMDKLYDGYCFDKLVRNDGLYQFIVYLPELKLTSRITSRENMVNYEKQQYKLFLFNNEDKFKKKIRLQIVTPLHT
jgi:exoribonuclease R